MPVMGTPRYMYVCLCGKVTDKQVKQAIEDGYRSIPELHNILGVCRDCCRCEPMLIDMIRQHRLNMEKPT